MQENTISWGPELRGQSLGIRMNGSLFTLGQSPVSLILFIANRGTNPIVIIETNLLADYSFEILRSDGEAVPWSAQGRQALENADEIRRRVIVEISPGSIHQVHPEARLDSWFELIEPGTYSVRLHRVPSADQPALFSGVAQFRLEEVR